MRVSCPTPFWDASMFEDGGFVNGRLCQHVGNVTCCLPCPMTDWIYPESFLTMGRLAEWIAVAGTVLILFLLLSWTVLPVEKTHRHYLSICLAIGVLCMNLGFVIPLAAEPAQCYDEITPNSMSTSPICAASGSLLIFGGWAGVMWVFLRSLSLHLQICWQVAVGRTFTWFAMTVGWGIPILGIILALVFSGVSFRFGSTCHINHENSLVVLWIPLLVFVGSTIILQLTTFAYCIRVYLASLTDNGATTENSNTYTNSIRTMTPKQAYRRIRRVIQLQWRGIVNVLVIVFDVIFFSIVFVFQDNTITSVANNPGMARNWVICLATTPMNKKAKCQKFAQPFIVPMPTVGALLVLLSMNGFWLLLFLGRWSILTGWRDLLLTLTGRSKREFVSVNARLDDLKKGTRSYEMLSGEIMGKGMTLVSRTPSVASPAVRSPPLTASTDPFRNFSNLSHQNSRSASDYCSMDVRTPRGGRRTPDFFGPAARYHAPARSFSNPRPPKMGHAGRGNAHRGQATGNAEEEEEYVNPLGMNKI